MSEAFNKYPEKFESPEDELKYLRERIREKEREFESLKEKPKTEEVISKEIKEYRKETDKGPLIAISSKEQQGIIEGLKPEPHDRQISELSNILEAKGIKNTFAVLDKMGNPHLEDDFHRFLVQCSGIDSLRKVKDVFVRTVFLTLNDDFFHCGRTCSFDRCHSKADFSCFVYRKSTFGFVDIRTGDFDAHSLTFFHEKRYLSDVIHVVAQYRSHVFSRVMGF